MPPLDKQREEFIRALSREIGRDASADFRQYKEEIERQQRIIEQQRIIAAQQIQIRKPERWHFSDYAFGWDWAVDEVVPITPAAPPPPTPPPVDLAVLEKLKTAE